MTCERCAALEEQVAWLRSELGLSHDASDLHALQNRFKLDLQQAKMLMTLYGANGRTLTTIFLHEAISKREYTYGSKLVHIRVKQLRTALGKEAIETLYGLGYRLSALGRARVYQTLKRLGA